MDASIRIISDQSGHTSSWRAVDGDDTVGTATAWLRPDGRSAVKIDGVREDVMEPLLHAMVAKITHPLVATLDEADEEGLRRYTQLGFSVARREGYYTIPMASAHAALEGAELPAGFTLAPVDAVPEETLMQLDDALRQEVPGTAGWQWDLESFREETYGSPAFDPELYWIALDEASGNYVGLVRVWDNPSGPRLGLIAVLPAYRRRGLARALMARVVDELAGRGATEILSEVDELNDPSFNLLTGLGARRVGGLIELVRDAEAAPSTPSSSR